jgi:hypothetical protein
MADEPIEGEVIEEAGSALAVRPASGAELALVNPEATLENATRVATVLAGALQKANLYTPIQGKRHVNAEGWTLLAQLTGHSPTIAWTRRTDDGWEARCEVLDGNGLVVSAAEAQALRTENAKWTREDYAVRSMAQTRATSKALKLRLGFIVSLAGFASTPAEEMPTDERRRAPEPEGPPSGAARIPWVQDERFHPIERLKELYAGKLDTNAILTVIKDLGLEKLGQVREKAREVLEALDARMAAGPGPGPVPAAPQAGGEAAGAAAPSAPDPAEGAADTPAGESEEADPSLPASADPETDAIADALWDEVSPKPPTTMDADEAKERIREMGSRVGKA